MISFSSFSDELQKIARVVALSGGAGAGKTTLSNRLGDQFDKVVHGDTWGVKVDEKGVRRPVDKTPEQKAKIFARRMKEVRKLDAQGKNVLVEGVPNVILNHPGLMEMADEVIHIDVPYSARLKSVMHRTKTQNEISPRLRDLGWIAKEHAEQIKAAPKLRREAGEKLTVVSRDDSWRHFGMEPPKFPLDVGKKIR